MMPLIKPLDALCFRAALDGSQPRDISSFISPPYDVLTLQDKERMLAQNAHNIVAIDLPHYPPKEAGPQAVYDAASRALRTWLDEGVLRRLGRPAFFVYQQAYEYQQRQYARTGLIANLPVQPFGVRVDGAGGIYPHEQTFSGPKEDRLRLMEVTRCQLSPVFGLYGDSRNEIAPRLSEVTQKTEDFLGRTPDGVLHRVWVLDDAATEQHLRDRLYGKDIYIADGHHRYTTALNYHQQLQARGEGSEAAGWCTFVLVSMQDPGMLVLPTHRVLSNLSNFSMRRFCEAAKGRLRVCRFESADLRELEAALPKAGPHAIGLYDASEPDPHRRLWITTPVEDDPLATVCPKQSRAWRQLDVAIGQHLIVDQICEPAFGRAGAKLRWSFPHTLKEFQEAADKADCGLGLLMQATPLRAVQEVSEAGDLMPQKSTFFYPKLASGLVLNPLA